MPLLSHVPESGCRRARSAALLVLAAGLTGCASAPPVVYSKETDSSVMNERTQGWR